MTVIPVDPGKGRTDMESRDMDTPRMKVLVTGGAGFVGSHLVDALLAHGHRVVCVDDLSLGREEHVAHHFEDRSFEFVRADLLDESTLSPLFEKGRFDTVFHMAANSDIRQGSVDTQVDLDRTFLTTFRVLACMDTFGVGRIVFPSSSAIYGELEGSLGEEAGPLRPVSFYGAAKLASEAYLSAYVSNRPIRAWVLRFPNVVGPRATHGVVLDFIDKLHKDPTRLEILGNGRQTKPYVHVDDVVSGMLTVLHGSGESFNVFNMSSETTTSVRRIGEIVVEAMGLDGVSLTFTGSDRGWVGDVPRFQYDTSRITRLGWRASRTSDEAVRDAATALLAREQQ